jgi:restriction endonuclease S subunit
MSTLKLKDIAKVLSGLYLRPSPTGTIFYLQASDLQSPAPGKCALKVDFVPKLDRYLLQKGDILFVGKGTKYLCQLFDLDIPAVPSTTLFLIRPNQDVVYPEYLHWYLNLSHTVSVIKSAQVGSSMPMTLKPTLEDLEVPVPDRATQLRVLQIAELQQKEQQLLKTISEKRTLLTNQLLLKWIMVND